MSNIVNLNGKPSKVLSIMLIMTLRMTQQVRMSEDKVRFLGKWPNKIEFLGKWSFIEVNSILLYSIAVGGSMKLSEIRIMQLKVARHYTRYM